ncbi:hypothetical protein AB4K05_15005 [Kluyvera sp. STS39-E]|uniref:hypothetical protein n=1 Tax=Kluyvera sp. STS39-E TaxID=3234748 RepID=UPI0034C5DCCC
MYKQLEKNKENKSRAVLNSVAQKKDEGRQAFLHVDNRPEVVAQRQLQEMVGNNYSQQQSIQKKENGEDLPDHLKSGIEDLPDYPIDDIKINYALGGASAFTKNVVQRVIGDIQKDTYVIEKNTRTIYYAVWNNESGHYDLNSVDDNAVSINFFMSVTPDNDNYSAIDIKEAKAIHSSKINEDCYINYFRDYYDDVPIEILTSLFEEACDEFDSFEDSKDYLDSQISRHQHLLKKKHKLKVNSSYPRVFVKGVDGDSQLTLKKLNKKEHELGVDLSYRDHRDAIDIELDRFLPDEEHDTKEYRKRYEAMTMADGSDSENDDGQNMTSTGGFPLTSNTVDLMSEYSNMHYRHQLKKPNHTSSTRAYEEEFLKWMKSEINVETMAVLNLPPGSDADPEQETMLNTFGAALDVNTPPKNNPIGKGKIYKTIYLHFKRTLEMINSELDKAELKDNLDNFAMRTRAHIQYLENNFLIGMRQNEDEFLAKEGESLIPRETVSNMIDSAQSLILNLAKGAELKEDLSSMFGEHTKKWLEVLGTVLGLYYKTIKRLIQSRLFIGEGTTDDLLNLFSKLGQLLDAEIKINNQLRAMKVAKATSRSKGKRKAVASIERTSSLDLEGEDGDSMPDSSFAYSGARAAQDYSMEFVPISGNGLNCYIRSIFTGLHRLEYFTGSIENAVSVISDHLESIHLRVGSQMIDAGGLVAAEARRAILELYNVDVGVTIITWNYDLGRFVDYSANDGAVQLNLFSTPGHFDLLG